MAFSSDLRPLTTAGVCQQTFLLQNFIFAKYENDDDDGENDNDEEEKNIKSHSLAILLVVLCVLVCVLLAACGCGVKFWVAHSLVWHFI